jgi:[NiFe] hydrogenase diaphorase moiety large subunit
MVIGTSRNLLKDVVHNYMEFFVEESCGSCVTCRTLNTILKEKLENLLHGKGVKADLDEMLKLGKILSMTSRCGLGQTSSNPIATTIQNFRHLYDSLIQTDADFVSLFDMADAVKDSCAFVKRIPDIHEN